MSAHSPDGYLALLRMRGQRTLLVEGRADRDFCRRLVAELSRTRRLGTGRILIDMADNVRGGGCPAGARERVEYVHSRTRGRGYAFAGLVDREYRRFRLHPDVVDEIGGHLVLDDSLFWTRGHSVENYLMTPGAALAFIRVWLPRLMTASLEEEVSAVFEDVMTWTASVCISLHEHGVLGRASGAVTPAMWIEVKQRSVRFDTPQFTQVLMARGVTIETAESIRTRAEAARLAMDSARGSVESRWLAHGSVGTEFMWAGIAAIGIGLGAEPNEIEAVATGHIETKARVAADDWVNRHLPGGLPADRSEVPRELIAWLCR